MREDGEAGEVVDVLFVDRISQLCRKACEFVEDGRFVGGFEHGDEVCFAGLSFGHLKMPRFDEAFELCDSAVFVAEQAALFALRQCDCSIGGDRVRGVVDVGVSEVLNLFLGSSDRPIGVLWLTVVRSREVTQKLDHCGGILMGL